MMHRQNQIRPLPIHPTRSSSVRSHATYNSSAGQSSHASHSHSHSAILYHSPVRPLPQVDEYGRPLYMFRTGPKSMVPQKLYYPPGSLERGCYPPIAFNEAPGVYNTGMSIREIREMSQEQLSHRMDGASEMMIEIPTKTIKLRIMWPECDDVVFSRTIDLYPTVQSRNSKLPMQKPLLNRAELAKEIVRAFDLSQQRKSELCTRDPDTIYEFKLVALHHVCGDSWQPEICLA